MQAVIQLSFMRLLAGCALLLTLAACGRETAVPAPAPAGDPLAQARGEWLLVNYWAEWCKPCLEEIPELNAFAREHAARARVLMVNYDGVQGEQLQVQARRLGIETVLLDTDPAARLGYQRPQVLPMTFVIGPDGRLRGTLIGPQTVQTLLASIEGA